MPPRLPLLPLVPPPQATSNPSNAQRIASRPFAFFRSPQDCVTRPQASTNPVSASPKSRHSRCGRPRRFALGFAAVVTTCRSTLVAPSPDATWLRVIVQVVSAGIPQTRARPTYVAGENAAVSQGHDVEVVAGALSRRDGLAGRIVVDGEIEADNQFQRVDW
jgi:hypothetical protein